MTTVSAQLVVWLLLLLAVVLALLRSFGVGAPRIDLGWLAAGVAGIAVLILLWPPT